MKQHKFTIIIPTRNRADVLEWALKTCITQEYKNLEIIVSDNYSEDRTREVVSSYNDKRIKYFNTGLRLSMSHNWEFALSKATGDYVSILGDDDGFLPNAIGSINDILNEITLPAICWHQSKYVWPNSGFHKHSLFIIMRKGIRIYEGKENLKKVLYYQNHYSTNPWLYGGFVKTDLLKSIREKSEGVFFHSRIPDIYSGIAVASQIGKYIYSIGPYSIAGVSSHSQGASSFSAEEKLRKAHYIFMTEADLIPFHPSLEFVASSIPFLVAESSLQAKKLGLIKENVLPGIKYVLQKCLDESIRKEDTVKYKEMEAFKKTAEINQINWDEIIENPLQKKITTIDKIKNELRQRLIGIYVDVKKTNIPNIYEASLFHEKVYNGGSKFFYNSIRKISELLHGNT